MTTDQLRKDPKKKHRHDIGEVDHGPATAETTTRTIQVLLGICIVLSAALVGYALVLAGSSAVAS